MNNNKKGFGDASCVGSGKTLTAISVIKEIIDINIERKEKQYSGFLILIPNLQLFETWTSEIKKHTSKQRTFSLFI